VCAADGVASRGSISLCADDAPSAMGGLDQWPVVSVVGRHYTEDVPEAHLKAMARIAETA